MKYKNFIVIGAGRFGSAVATTLFEMGYDVLAVDKDETSVQEISGKVTKAVIADCTDEESLRSLGISNFDVAIIAIASNTLASIISTVIVKEIGVPYIVCKASDKLQARALIKIGADKIIFPERDMGIKTAKALGSDNFLERIAIDTNFSIADIIVPENWIGKTIVELDLRNKYALNIIALRKDDKLITNFDPTVPFEKDTEIYFIGDNKNIDKVS